LNGLHIACVGRLGGDPETKYTSGGKLQLVFSIAVDENTTATENRPAAETQWIRCTLWEEKAEALADVLVKGGLVYIEGRLKHDRWQSAAGEPRCGLSVSAWKCEPLGLIGRNAPRRERELMPAGGE
jgi:single-strand DNA-binding protein